jgi:hypothetical protein
MVITAILSALAAWIFTYLDARLFDAPKSKFTYFKIMSMTALISALIVYFMGGAARQPAFYSGPTMMPMSTMAPVAGQMTGGMGNSTAIVANMGGERIFTGQPGF